MPPPARGVLFRNAWPPNWARPDPALVYVHQQAFEFRGIPSSWVAPLNGVPDDVWVPSAFNKQARLLHASSKNDQIAILKTPTPTATQRGCALMLVTLCHMHPDQPWRLTLIVPKINLHDTTTGTP